MPKQKQKERRFPTNDDLLAWWLYDFYDHSLDITPEKIFERIKEFSRRTSVKVHKYLYSEYKDFSEEFLPVE